MSTDCQLRLKAVGPASAAAAVDLAAVTSAALIQLFGVIGGAIPFSFNPDGSSNSEGVLTVDKRDEAKVRSALALVSSHQGKPLRIELGEATDS